MTTHERSIRDYRTDTLQAILADYQKRTRKDSWDTARIAAIQAELERRRRERIQDT
jgi:hypothetical protein